MLKVKKSWLITGVLLLLVGAIVWKQMQPQPFTVWVVTAEAGRVEATVANTRAGTIKACRRSKLSMPIGGVVDRLLVTEGDEVVVDQLLLELWNRDRSAEVAQARQQLAAVRSDRESACLLAELKGREAKRIRALAARNLASEDDLDNAETVAQSQQRACEAASNQSGVAEARLDLQQAIFERTQLRAPFAGVVAEINGEVGEYITPSPPGIPTPAAVDLIDYSCLYVTAPIDEVDAGRLENGLQARVTLDAFRDQPLTGVVTRIAPYVLDLEKQARTVDVDVKLDQLPESVDLLVGYSADLTIILEQRDKVLRLPTEAVLPDNFIWVLDAENRLRKRQVQTGIGNWSWVEITAGLQAGERVVRNPDKEGIAEGLIATVADD